MRGNGRRRYTLRFYWEDLFLLSVKLKQKIFQAMPFIKRKSSPVNVSEVKLDDDVTIQDELECVANHTLCGIIQQLSNLNQNASGVFDELCDEAVAIYNRTNNLKTKVDGMKERYKKWNKIKGGASFDKVDIENDTPLSQHFDQQLLGQGNRTVAIKTMYESANPPPDFSKTNPYRDDGRHGLTFYTDPTFFFVTWSSEMQKEHHNRKIRRQDRKTSNENGEHRPREIKRKQDELRDKANRAEFSEVKPASKHKRRKKKKKMEGFSNVSWEKQHQNSEKRKGNETLMHDSNVENKGSRDGNEQEVSNSVTHYKEHSADVTPPLVPMRKQNTTTQKGDLISAQQDFEELPPPPPGLDLPPPPGGTDLPPPPPDPPAFLDGGNCQSFIMPPAPPDFFKSHTSSVVNERESNFPLPPPPIDTDNDVELPPPLRPRISETRNDLQSKRISTFVHGMGNNITELVKPTMNRSQPPVIPQTNGPLPPAPPPPPPPLLPQGLPSIPTTNGQSTSVSKNSDADQGGIPTENALLAMKQKLQTKERRIKPALVASTNAFDVHTIMSNALENHRKFIEDSSSEDESEFTDSDSDWD